MGRVNDRELTEYAERVAAEAPAPSGRVAAELARLFDVRRPVTDRPVSAVAVA